MWNVKVAVIPVIIGATGTISKSLRLYLSNIPGRHEIKELKEKKTILCTAHLLRKMPMLKYKTHFAGKIILHVTQIVSGFGGLEVACWPLVPKFAGSNLSTPSFVGEVKPSVPCRRFAVCKRSLNGVDVVISAKLPDIILAHSSTFRR
jgi:hypothetical protein